SAGHKQPVADAMLEAVLDEDALGRPAFGVEPRKGGSVGERADERGRLAAGAQEVVPNGKLLDLVPEALEERAPFPRQALCELLEPRPLRLRPQALGEQVLRAETLDLEPGDA